MIAPGVYTYKFQCNLPKELPTSCEEKFVFIRYLASVHIVLQPLSVDKVHSVAFTVIKPYNLNAEPMFQVSISQHSVRRRQQNTTNVISVLSQPKIKERIAFKMRFSISTFTVCNYKTEEYQFFSIFNAQTESIDSYRIDSNIRLCTRTSDFIAIGCAK